ncbi:MAG: amidase family protein, partial [bacterium]|nr:amidase family protein [bacterium]
GAEIVEVSCPSFDYSLAAYYLVLPAEASSNLARFDGMKYGLRVEPSEGPVTAERVMAATRGAGFGPEVKRRVILGTHALSAGYFDAYYGSAQKVRTIIQSDFAAAFAQADVLVSPAAPTTAFRFGEKMDDPLAMYLNDAATTPANMAGVPAMSLPSGLADDGLPVGFQIIAPAREDARMYEVAGPLERALEERWGGPLLEVHRAALDSALASGLPASAGLPASGAVPAPSAAEGADR